MCSSRPDDDPSQHDLDDGLSMSQIRELERVGMDADNAAVGWPRDDEGRLFHRHLFWQDEILPRKEGECDYTFNNGDWCGKLPGHAIHDLAETPS